MKKSKNSQPVPTVKQAIQKNLLYLLLGLTVMGFALISLGIGIANQANSNFILSHGVKAEATITSVDRVFRNNKTTFTPNAVYFVEEKEYRNTWQDLKSGNVNNFKVGDKISISYLESNPNQVVLTGNNFGRESFQPTAVAIAYGLLGLFGFSFGVRNVIRIKKRK